MSNQYTPMMQQYCSVKKQHPDDILFFRLGDFYEMFFEDAQIASRELELTLTGREGGMEERIPMCGVPYHAAESYIARLIQKGYHVAICEQTEDPKQVKGIVKREVIRVITPATFMGNQEEASNHFLFLVWEEEARLGAVAADISTGECLWTELAGERRLAGMLDHLYRLAPVEFIWAGSEPCPEDVTAFLTEKLPNCFISNYVCQEKTSQEKLLREHFPLEEIPESLVVQSAVNKVLSYLYFAAKSDMGHMNHLRPLDTGEHMVLDATSLRNLEITRNLRDGSRKHTLFEVLDFTQTAMGSRLLKQWLEYPLFPVHRILYRQRGVKELVEKLSLRKQLQAQLKQIYDFERILTKIELGSAGPRDLEALYKSLIVLPELIRLTQELQEPILANIHRALSSHPEIVELLKQALAENCPISLKEGNVIREGYSLELDEYRLISRNSKEWIQNLEIKEKESSGLRSLKVGYNRVFGYYIETSRANAELVPAHYTRKQTLANTERYITPELKEFEMKVLGAQEKILALEYQLFCEVRDSIKVELKAIQETARHLAVLDGLSSLSEAAFSYQYICPEMTVNQKIHIQDGRHPVVERLLHKELFIPNDVHLNHDDTEIALITGPNMAGKSTYMRQTALLVLMSQVGSFIPARKAAISPVDRIFTRIGASDDLATGQSTFMIEMNEAAHILKYATNKSLIILDEIGRGTSTYDGMSIARAIMEYLAERIQAKTLFATHYHELTDMADHWPRIQNFTVAVQEKGKKVVFLRRIIPGKADKSYGIHVAELAGLPIQIINRANTILEKMETPEKENISTTTAEIVPVATSSIVQENSLFSSSWKEKLMTIDVVSLTPIEAMNVLWKLQQEVKAEEGGL